METFLLHDRNFMSGTHARSEIWQGKGYNGSLIANHLKGFSSSRTPKSEFGKYFYLLKFGSPPSETELCLWVLYNTLGNYFIFFF